MSRDGIPTLARAAGDLRAHVARAIDGGFSDVEHVSNSVIIISNQLAVSVGCDQYSVQVVSMRRLASVLASATDHDY